MEYEMEPIEFVTVDSHTHTQLQCGPCPLCRLIVRCHILLWSVVLPEFIVGIKESSPPRPCLQRPAIGGMDGVEEMDAG